MENRKEILLENTGKVYFILNKVDQKTEKDREIADVIEDLRRELADFGFPSPIIYPASSRQGLLAKLILQGKAIESQLKDFKSFSVPNMLLKMKKATRLYLRLVRLHHKP